MNRVLARWAGRKRVPGAMDRMSAAAEHSGLECVQCPSLQFAVFNPLEHPDWDGLLATHSEGSFFQSLAWAKVLFESYGYNPKYFAAYEDNRLLGLLPVMQVESWLTGRRGVSLPFTDAAEPLDCNALLKDRLVPLALQYGKDNGWKYFECRGGQNIFKDAQSFESFFTHKLGLFANNEIQFARLDSATRRAIRKAQSLGLKVEISQDIGAVRSFYTMHCLTRKKHGLPPQPFRFFDRIHKNIISTGKGVVILARYGKRMVAGGVYFLFGPEVLYKYGASDHRYQEVRGNNLVMWEAIKWAAQQGAKVMQFGRTSVKNGGLRRYKLGWGAEEHMVYYYRYDLFKNCFVSCRERSSDWYCRTFSMLPVSISKWIGSALYRHVA